MERFQRATRLSAARAKPWWDEEAQKQASDDALPESETLCVLVQNGVKGTRISAVGPDGASEGFWVGMKLADARSMMPHVRVEQHDALADARALKALAHGLLRYSPAVSICGEDGFLLDTTGCDHLFGGENQMLQAMRAGFRKMGFTGRLALADTVGATIALVTCGRDDVHILPKGHDTRPLAALPVEALRLDDDTVTLLKRLGLKTIGDVQPLPRPALARRFRTIQKTKSKNNPAHLAQSVQWRLDQLSGAISEPLICIQEPRPFRATMPCPELALEPEAVGIALERLLPDIFAMLAKAGLGARGIRLTGYRADGGSGYAEVCLSQCAQDPVVVKRLFRDRLERIDCGFGIDLFVLEAFNTEKVQAVQNGMMGTATPQITASSIAAFADIVNHKTNSRAVVKPAPRASHVPERAQHMVKATQDVDWHDTAVARPVLAPRPTRLLSRPEPAEVTAELPDSPPVQFLWRKVLRRVVRSRGPERILPEWWKDELATPGASGIRDYYDVEDSTGLRYWIYRSIRDHAVEEDACDAEGGDEALDDEQKQTAYIRTTQWFVHGLF